MRLTRSGVIVAIQPNAKEDVMQDVTLKIEGMSCQHCVMRVKKAVDDLPGIGQADVGIGTARVKFDEAKVSRAEIESAVEKAGYKIGA